MPTKVPSGEAVMLSPATFARMVDTQRGFEESRRGGAPLVTPAMRSTGIILIRNESGADRAAFDVLGIGVPLITRKDNQAEFEQRVVVQGLVPAATHVGKFAVLLEPLPINGIGRGLVNGVHAARVEMVDESHSFADVKPGDATVLQSAVTGLARLLWIEPIAERAATPVASVIAYLGGGEGGRSARFVQITSVAGALPPYRYSATDASMDIDGAWTQVAGGASYNNVFNLEEQGSGGQWVNPLLVNDVVALFPPPDTSIDAWVCSRSHYRGTF